MLKLELWYHDETLVGCKDLLLLSNGHILSCLVSLHDSTSLFSLSTVADLSADENIDWELWHRDF